MIFKQLALVLKNRVCPEFTLLYVSKSSDFWVCPLILNSHSIRSGIRLRRKFNNQQNTQHTFAVRYKHLRPAL